MKTTWNSLNITIQRLNSVFCIEYCFCGLSYDFEKKETHLQLHRTGPNWKETDGINSAQSSVKSHPFWITLYVKFKRNSRLDNSRTSYILYLFGAYMQSAVLLLMYNGSVHEGNWIWKNKKINIFFFILLILDFSRQGEKKTVNIF